MLSYLFPVMFKIYSSIKNKTTDTLSFKIAFYGLIISTLLISAYCFRFPEKYFEPGTFDKIGSSHNLMHLGVITASISEVLYVFVNAKEGNYIKSFK
jgi:predicted membrane channel-forming protein YqfA (hemolysin III family)